MVWSIVSRDSAGWQVCAYAEEGKTRDATGENMVRHYRRFATRALARAARREMEARVARAMSELTAAGG